MAWKTMAEIDWEELAKADSISFAYLDSISFVDFRFHLDLPFGHNMCPIRSDVENEVSDYFRFSAPGSNDVVKPVMNIIVPGPIPLSLSLSSRSGHFYLCYYDAFFSCHVCYRCRIFASRIHVCGRFVSDGQSFLRSTTTSSYWLWQLERSWWTYGDRMLPPWGGESNGSIPSCRLGECEGRSGYDEFDYFAQSRSANAGSRWECLVIGRDRSIIVWTSLGSKSTGGGGLLSWASRRQYGLSRASPYFVEFFAWFRHRPSFAF